MLVGSTIVRAFATLVILIAMWEECRGQPFRSPVDRPNIHIDDPVTRDAVTRAVDGALQRLGRSKCQRVFAEFRDDRNLPLTARLHELQAEPQSYLARVAFLDGSQFATCRRDGVLAFTARNGRGIYLCGRDFERRSHREPEEAQITIIHELLHTLGLGENPPSPRDITYRVKQLCW